MTSAVQVQYRRGSSSQVASFTGAAGELVVDTTNNRVVVQDGATAGGFPAAKLAEVQTNARTQVSDGNYTVLNTDRTVAYITLTGARTVSLPAASTYPTGTRLLVIDESGACSGTSTITFGANGSDLIDGAATAIINSAYGYMALQSNGLNKWTIVDQVAASSSGAVNSGGMVNKFRNGTMDVWQRGTSGTIAANTNSCTADGWIVAQTVSSGSNTVAWAQASGRLITKNSLQMTGNTNVTGVIVKQRIESLIAAAFCSQTVTVQAQIYNGTGGPITPKLTVNRATGVDNGTYSSIDVNAVSLQACATSAWTLVSYAFSANANSFDGLEIVFDFGNNFGANTKSVQIAELDIRVTSGVSTGLNSSPPPPELRPIPTELGLCQRYFSTNFGNGITPANDAAQMNYTGVATSTAVVGVGLIPFPVAMRIAPALAFFSSAVGTPVNGEWAYQISGTWVWGTPSVAGAGGIAISQLGVALNLVTSGLTTGSAYVVTGMWSASAEL